jgi:homoserine kinase
MSGRRVRVRVPASSANLGPGFDTLAAALALHLEVEVVETGAFSIACDLDVPRDRANLLVRAFERLLPADDFAFHIASTIPLSGGLGSSAAAVVAGLLAANALTGAGADVLELATAIEGHPDNVGAALAGGFVVCADGEVARLDVPEGLGALLVVPGEAVRTAEARAALPPEVPMADAVFGISHAALLTAGLATARWDLLARGLRDRLHQPRRAHLYPRSAALLERATAWGALGATISGAGPTVLVWTRADATDTVLSRLREEAGGWADVLRVPFEAEGARIF